MTPLASPVPRPEVKQCCATFYGSDAVRFLLGDSFHPGGTALTHELGERLQLSPQSRVLDVAAGRGTSALYLAEHFGCEVVGVDLSENNIQLAEEAAAARGLGQRVRFVLGDAEHLPFADASFSAAVCECAFCTFPDKATAAAELRRVLLPGGQLGLTDLTRQRDTTPDLDGLLAWVACIGDAQTVEAYQQWLQRAGLVIEASEDRSGTLSEMVRDIRGRMLLAEIMVGTKKLSLPGFDPAQARSFLKAATEAIAGRRLGYHLLTARANS